MRLHDKKTILILLLIISFSAKAVTKSCCICSKVYNKEEIKELEVKLENSPNSYELLLKLSEANYCLGDEDKTRYYIEKAIEANPNSGDGYYLLGLISSRIYGPRSIVVNKTDLLCSIDYFQKAICNGYKLAESYMAIAMVQEKLKEYSSAIFNYEKSIQLGICCSPNSPHIQLTEIYLIRGEYTTAHKYYNEGIKLGYSFDDKLTFIVGEYWDEELKEKLYEEILLNEISTGEQKLLVNILAIYISESTERTKKVKTKFPNLFKE